MKIHGLEFEKPAEENSKQISEKPKKIQEKKQVKLSHPEQDRRTRPEQGRRKKKMKNPANLILIIVVVILAGALGWVLLGDKISLPWSGDDLLSPVSEKKAKAKKVNIRQSF